MIINLNPKNPIENGFRFLVSKGFTLKETEECRKFIRKKIEKIQKDSNDWIKLKPVDII